MPEPFLSKYCQGEKCHVCKQPAYAKVEEVIFDDDPYQLRHPLTAYLCREHFTDIMGNRGLDIIEEARVEIRKYRPT